MMISSRNWLHDWKVLYDRRKRSLLKIGYIIPGSVVKRFMPYYQWSVALQGKPVAKRLTVEQARLYRDWTRNNRNLKRLLDGMRKISMRVAKHQTKNMPRRMELYEPR